MIPLMNDKWPQPCSIKVKTIFNSLFLGVCCGREHCYKSCLISIKAHRERPVSVCVSRFVAKSCAVEKWDSLNTRPQKVHIKLDCVKCIWHHVPLFFIFTLGQILEYFCHHEILTVLEAEAFRKQVSALSDLFLIDLLFTAQLIIFPHCVCLHELPSMCGYLK